MINPPLEAQETNIDSKDNDIKTYVQTLTPLHLESSLKLEELAFPPEERGSRSKFEYRFATCSELCLGLFTSADTSLATGDSLTSGTTFPGSASTADTATPVTSDSPERKSVLLGHVIATKTTNPLLRDEDMDIPSDWPGAPAPVAKKGTEPGHKEKGRTLCIHSLAILPQFQGRGLGRLLLRAYIGRMKDADIADRIAIIAHGSLAQYYKGFGFEDKGESPVEFGGGGWHDMVLELQTFENESD